MVHDARDRVLLAKSMYGRVLVAVWPALALAQEIWPNLQIHNGARALHRPQFSSIEFLHNSEVLNDS